MSWRLEKKYQIEISNWFAALEKLSESKDIYRTWENIKENIKTPAEESLGLHELKQHKPCFEEESLGFFFYQRKRSKMQWVQDPSQSNVDNLNNVRCEVIRNFRNKMKEYLKAEIDELETNSKIKKY